MTIALLICDNVTVVHKSEIFNTKATTCIPQLELQVLFDKFFSCQITTGLSHLFLEICRTWEQTFTQQDQVNSYVELGYK